MRRAVFRILLVHTLVLSGRLLAGDQPVAEDELTRLKREYADVLALQGISKAEILAVARILRAKPEMAIESNSGEWRILFQQRPRDHGSLCYPAGAHAGRRYLRIRRL